MHMSDALISPIIGGAMYAVSTAAVAYSIKKSSGDELTETKIPLIAVSGAFVFAAQMINFTIPMTGSSGHIGGGMLLAALVGGAPALMSLAAVLIIQCLMFADGGLLALGCNTFNMAVLPCLVVYPLVYKPLSRGDSNVKSITIASIVSSVVALQLGAFAVVVETLLSGVTELPFRTFALLMQPIHLAIGVGEGLITAAVLCFVSRVRPEVLTSSTKQTPKNIVVALLILTIITAGALSLFASAYPDGLEWSIENTAGNELRMTETAENITNARDSIAVMPDYAYKSDPERGTTEAGLIGSFAVLALAGCASFVITKTRRRHNQH